MTTNFECWLWPDHNIGKRESRQLREEHNHLVNAYEKQRVIIRELSRAVDALKLQLLQSNAMGYDQTANALDVADYAIDRAKELL